VDNAGHIQLIKNKETSEGEFKWQIDNTEKLLESMREHDKDPDRWTLSIVDEGEL
jgi:hypothetical protein